MADLNKLFNRLKTMGNVSQWGINNPDALTRIAIKHPEYGNKWANVVRRTMNDLGNSGAPLNTLMPDGSTLKDVMRTAPMLAEMNEDISSALRAGAQADDIIGKMGAAYAPRVDRLRQLYKTLT